MHSALKSLCLGAVLATFAKAAAIEREPSSTSVAPSCGGDQAVCCTGSYNLEGETISNCITCMDHPTLIHFGHGTDDYRRADCWCVPSSIQRILLLYLRRAGE